MKLDVDFKRKKELSERKTKEIIKGKTRLTRRQKHVLKALAKTNGIVSRAAKIGGFVTDTHYKYLKTNPDYALAYEQICEATIDLAEASLLNQIVGENTQATIFYLKTKGKHRGYIERSEVTHQVLTPKMIEIVKE